MNQTQAMDLDKRLGDLMEQSRGAVNRERSVGGHARLKICPGHQVHHAILPNRAVREVGPVLTGVEACDNVRVPQASDGAGFEQKALHEVAIAVGGVAQHLDGDQAMQGRLGDDEKSLRDGLSEIRMAYVQIHNAERSRQAGAS